MRVAYDAACKDAMSARNVESFTGAPLRRANSELNTRGGNLPHAEQEGLISLPSETGMPSTSSNSASPNDAGIIESETLLLAPLWFNELLKGYCNMALRVSAVVRISEARARFTELAEDVVGSGNEKVLTKNGASYVALVDARRLDYYHALEAEHANLVLADDAITALGEALAGQFASDDELDAGASA